MRFNLKIKNGILLKQKDSNISTIFWIISDFKAIKVFHNSFSLKN